MAITSEIVRVSELVILYGELDAPTGATVTLSAVTWTLYDTNQQPVSGLVDQAVTEFDSSPAQMAQGSLDFQPSVFALTPGEYALVLKLSGTDSNGRARIRGKRFLLTILPDSL